MTRAQQIFLEPKLAAGSRSLEHSAVVGLPTAGGWLRVCGGSGIEVERTMDGRSHCHAERVGTMFA